MMRLLCALVIALAFVVPEKSLAHDLGLAQVTVSSFPDGSLVLNSKLSATISADAPIVPDACTGHTQTLSAPDPRNQRLETRIHCPDGSNSGQILLPWEVDGVFLISQSPGRESEAVFVPAGSAGVALNVGDLLFEKRDTLDVATLYTQLGIKHILIGLDHLALLVCLALLAQGMVLVRLVTAFTIGHSITLCLAALNVVHVPVAPVEVLIVLSVAYLARDVWLGRAMDRNSTLLLVGIGLLHGLGFASVLSEIGLPQGGLLFALLSFNVGIEIGQLIFLTAVIAMLAFVRRLAPVQFFKPVPYGLSFLVGSMAMYWTFERVAGFYV
jgi:HupE / UreJ protein